MAPHPFLPDTDSGLRVGDEARGLPRTGRELGVGSPGSRGGGPIDRPLRIDPPCSGTDRSGARPKPEAEPARGRRWGGFRTPIPSRSDRRGRPLRLRVTGGQRSDRTQARALVEAWTDAPLLCLIADRAYDRDGFRGRAGATGH